MNHKDFKSLLLNILQSYHFVSNALIFGSYATQKQHAMSDIDIAIQTHREITLFEMGDIISNLESHLHLKVDLVILNDLYLKNPLLAYNIYLSHQAVFISDESSYRDFKLKALHYYMDFEPALEAQNRSFLKRIRFGTLAKTQTA